MNYLDNFDESLLGEDNKVSDQRLNMYKTYVTDLGRLVELPDYQCRNCLHEVNFGITHEGFNKYKPTLWETIYYQTTWYTCHECGHKWEKDHIVEETDIREIPMKIRVRIQEFVDLIKRSF